MKTKSCGLFSKDGRFRLYISDAVESRYFKAFIQGNQLSFVNF